MQQSCAAATVDGAGVVRYLYGVPVAGVYLLAWLAVGGGALPTLASFWWHTLGGGLAQIIATNLLIHSFRLLRVVFVDSYCLFLVDVHHHS
jgi:hypothetical protein